MRNSAVKLCLTLALASLVALAVPGCAAGNKKQTQGAETVAQKHSKKHKKKEAQPTPAPTPDASETEAGLAAIASGTAEGQPEVPFEPPDEAVPEEDEEEAAPAAEANTPAARVAAALEACESAQQSWEQGDIDTSLDLLDHAYSLLLELPADDPEFAQSRQDLRHLISRRIVEIYRSRLQSAAELGSPIQVDYNQHVEYEIRSFQGPERSFFLESYRRSGAYRPMIVHMLREAGLPEELSWLPLVESGFKTRAMSRARAVGMWQFISSTGYRYGLSRSEWIDERMDPEKATQGAIDYLTELHGMFGDWMTALASYNCGEHRVMSVIMRQEDQYLDHFWDVFNQLPRETARYVPRFLATLLIVRDPAKYGFDLPEPRPPLAFESMTITRHTKLDDLDRALGLVPGSIAELNPELRRGVTPATAYELRVPTAAAPLFNATVASLPSYTPPKEAGGSGGGVHRVKRGETLSTIAGRYHTSVNSIMRANNLRSSNKIYVGQRLRIPGRGGRTTTVASAPAAPPVTPPATTAETAAIPASTTTTTTTATPSTSTPGEAAIPEAETGTAEAMAEAAAPAVPVKHRVRAGDNLWNLASRYSTTVETIKRDNGLRGEQLYVGQTLRINPPVPAGTQTYAVRRGDTVAQIAREHGVSLSAMLAANGLSKGSTIYPGQMLIIPE